jgi:hypothetical protein
VLRIERTSPIILGADWLDRVDLLMAVEDQFAGVEITDNDVDRIEVVGDLISLIEILDNERRRRGAAPVVRKLLGPHFAHADQTVRLRRSCFVFLRVAGDTMRNLIGWCPETRQPIDLKIYVDDATPGPHLVQSGSVSMSALRS